MHTPLRRYRLRGQCPDAVTGSQLFFWIPARESGIFHLQSTAAGSSARGHPTMRLPIRRARTAAHHSGKMEIPEAADADLVSARWSLFMRVPWGRRTPVQTGLCFVSWGDIPATCLPRKAQTAAHFIIPLRMGPAVGRSNARIVVRSSWALGQTETSRRKGEVSL